MNTRIVLGMLMASGEERFAVNGVPLLVAFPEYRLVPYWRVTPARPGSSVNLMDAGATPVVVSAARADVVSGTLKVSLPVPALPILSVPEASPWLQLSTARKTVVVSGCRMGYW